MAEELNPQEIEQVQFDSIEAPQELELAPALEEELPVVEEPIKKVTKKTKKVESNIFKVNQIIQKRPSTYRLNVEGKGQVTVHKSKFDRESMTVEL